MRLLHWRGILPSCVWMPNTHNYPFTKNGPDHLKSVSYGPGAGYDASDETRPDPMYVWSTDCVHVNDCVVVIWHYIQDKNSRCENSIWSWYLLQNVKNTKTSKVQRSSRVQRLEKGQRCKGWNSSMFVTVTLFPASDFILRFAIYEMVPHNNNCSRCYNYYSMYAQAGIIIEAGLTHAFSSCYIHQVVIAWMHIV